MLLAGRLLNEELVFGRTPRVWPGIDNELAILAQHAFAAGKRVLDQLSGREILPKLCGLQLLRNGKNGRTSSDSGAGKG